MGYDGQVTFLANAQAIAPNKLSVNSGNNQRTAIGQPLGQPLIVVATDRGNNRIEGATIQFAITKGSGHLKDSADPTAKPQTINVITDSDGRASAQWTVGLEAGLDIHRVTATILQDNQGTLTKTGLTAGFTAGALIPGDAGNTSITGTVLDNQDNPVPGVTIRVDGYNRQAVADDQGNFKIENVPTGPVHLLVEGQTTTRAGDWPTLSYNLITVAGATNPLSAPIYLVPLDTENARQVGHEDVEYTLEEIPGFKLTIKKGSITFPDGQKTGLLSVTAVNANKVPMAPPNGMQPQFIVTIQPTGAVFDPPAPLTLPNVDAYPVGSQVEMYSYDHDLEEFVTIGLGTISKDGSVIESNPGVGVIKAGWHCGSGPSPGARCCGSCAACWQFDDEGCGCDKPKPGDTPPAKDKKPYDVLGNCKQPACGENGPELVNDDGDGEYCPCLNSVDDVQSDYDKTGFLFAKMQACIARKACEGATQPLHFEKPQWINDVVSDFTREYTNRTGTWNDVISTDWCNGVTSESNFISQFKCSEQMAKYHINTDLSDTVYEYGCGTQNDWDKIGLDIKSCIASDLQLGDEGFFDRIAKKLAADDVIKYRTIVNNQCKDRRGKEGKPIPGEY